MPVSPIIVRLPLPKQWTIRIKSDVVDIDRFYNRTKRHSHTPSPFVLANSLSCSSAIVGVVA